MLGGRGFAPDDNEDLVGRDGELARAVVAIGSGHGVVITGEAGVGKTALLSAAVRRSGRRALAGQCFRALAWTAGMPLQQATGRPIPAGDPSWTAQWLVQACGTAILRIDDLQWADPFTLGVLALLPPSITLVATVRVGEPGSDAALAVLAATGVVRIDLEPLDAAAGAELARRAHPRLGAADAAALARRCGGNPLLIEELGDDVEPNAGLRRTVVNRLRRQGEAVSRGFALLALAGEPLPAAWLPDVDGLVASGLAIVAADDIVAPRHPLLAEVMAAELGDNPERSRTVHLELADRAAAENRLALAARSAAAGGDHDRALDLALAAVELTDRPGERAGLLHLAAESATPERAEELAIRALEALVDVGDFTQAASLVERIQPAGSAHWHGLIGRVLWETGDADAAIASYEAGLAVAPPDSADAVLLECERARAVMLGLGDGPRALELARAAHDKARAHDVELARATGVLGLVEYFNDIATCVGHMREATELAAASGELLVRFTSANNLIAMLESFGDTERACAIADEFVQWAEELRLRGWQQQMRAMGLNVRMHTGEYQTIVEQAPGMLAGALERRTRDQLEVTLGIALVDLGRNREAVARLTAALEHCVDDRFGRGNLLWVLAEAQLSSGDLADALSTATAAAELIASGDMQLFPLLTIAQAQGRLGRPLVPDTLPPSDMPVLAAAPAEFAGYQTLAAGSTAEAAAHFAAAAVQWTGQHRRAALRCRWLAAHYSPDDDHAIGELQELEQELVTAGWAPLLGQVRRSLRARGVRSAAPRSAGSRGRGSELTAREREVLDLVGEGLSTDAVAARLGLSPSTVAAQIASARARLGASSRWQAASGA